LNQVQTISPTSRNRSVSGTSYYHFRFGKAQTTLTVFANDSKDWSLHLLENVCSQYVYPKNWIRINIMGFSGPGRKGKLEIYASCVAEETKYRILNHGFPF
jgi:hypothetical protein